MATRAVPMFIVCLAVLVACATSPTGRRQLTLLPDDQMNDMGAQAFQQMKGETPIEKDSNVDTYVECVAHAITDLPRVQEINRQWEVVVFDEKTVNAFALPGGKIGVYRGMLTTAQTPGQLAAVLGHEVGHVVARHGNERVSQQMAAATTLGLIDQWMAAENNENRKTAMALIGAGAQYGVLLPYSRVHESEADEIGQELMAQAGFDPRESVTLWQNMVKAGGSQPPEFLSTHPAHETRIKALQRELDRTLPIYKKAQAAGHRPQCQTPAVS